MGQADGNTATTSRERLEASGWKLQQQEEDRGATASLYTRNEEGGVVLLDHQGTTQIYTITEQQLGGRVFGLGRFNLDKFLRVRSYRKTFDTLTGLDGACGGQRRTGNGTVNGTERSDTTDVADDNEGNEAHYRAVMTGARGYIVTDGFLPTGSPQVAEETLLEKFFHRTGVGLERATELIESYQAGRVTRDGKRSKTVDDLFEKLNVTGHTTSVNAPAGIILLKRLQTVATEGEARKIAIRAKTLQAYCDKRAQERQMQQAQRPKQKTTAQARHRSGLATA